MAPVEPVSSREKNLVSVVTKQRQLPIRCSVAADWQQEREAGLCVSLLTKFAPGAPLSCLLDVPMGLRR